MSWLGVVLIVLGWALIVMDRVEVKKPMVCEPIVFDDGSFEKWRKQTGGTR